MTDLGYQNLNFARPTAAHARDLEHLAERCEVIGAVELRARHRLDGFRTIQPRRRGHLGEALFVRKNLEILESGSKLAALSLRRQRIGWRRIVWVVVETDRGPLAVVVVHMPPKRMQRALWVAYAWRLRRLLAEFERRGLDWVAAGDWNRDLDADPCRLRRRLGASWRGHGIDGYAVSRRLARRQLVTRTQLLGRPDGHPRVYLTV